MAHKIQIKRGNKADLPTLDDGEFGLCQDTNELFIGNDGNQKIFPPTEITISDVEGLQTALDGKVDDSQVLTNVPANAKFTDTVYTHPATHSADMIVDGTTNKVFTATEKDKLAGIAANANNYTHPTTAGNKHIPSGGSNGKILGYDSDGAAKWIDPPAGVEIANNLTETEPGKALDATQGKVLADLVSNSSGVKTARFVVGTSTAGWTAADVDYLCDGTNDATQIIAALNALPATGGEIVILDGTYNITASIHIPTDNVSIRGNGNATILKRMYDSTNTNSGSTARGLITLNGKSGCKIQGLQIDGNDATYTANNNYGIYLSSSSNNMVTGNTCNNNSYNGISLSSSSNNMVTGNTCNNNNYYGIFISSFSNNNTVTGNTCNNNSDGIRLNTSSNNTITGNTCNNNSYGIRASSSSNNTITGNTCIRGTGQTSDYTSSQHTIYLFGMGSDYNLISLNNCMGKAVVIGGGTGNSAWGNKFDNTDNLP